MSLYPDSKFERLTKGTWIYLHGKKNAYLGRYELTENCEATDSGRGDEPHVFLSGGNFHFTKLEIGGSHFFVPSLYDVKEKVVFPKRDIIDLTYKIYVGREEIKRGMSEESNPSFELMRDLTSGFR